MYPSKHVPKKEISGLKYSQKLISYNPHPYICSLHIFASLSIHSSLEAFSYYKKNVATLRALTDESITSGSDRHFLSYCPDLLSDAMQ